MAESVAKYQRYDEYKESGVEWLSQLPVGWSVERTKRMLSLRRELVGANSLDYQLLSLTLRGVIPRDISNGDGKIPADFSTYQEVEKKDLVFCLFDIDETPRTVGLSPENGMITGAYNVYKTSDKCSSRYAYYYFLHIDLRKGLRPFYTGLRKVVRSETFSNIKMPCPSYEEQTQIANFLDFETAQIDTLIDKQQTLIQLLKEKRQAVISHAVTKGLNPDVPMKDSGVEWLGEVPEHWRVCNLKHIKAKQSNAFVDGPFGSNLKSIHFVDDGDVFVIESNFATTGIVDESKLKKITLNHFNTISRSEAKAGDIIIAKIGARFGMSSILPKLTKRSVVSGNSLKLTLDSDICNTEYIKFLLQHLKNEGAMDDGVNVTAQPALSLGGLNNLPVLLPPYSEQNTVIEELHRLLYKLSDLTNHAEQAIQLMQERRTALISAAVTGKIDVRGWRAPIAPDNAKVEMASTT